MFSITSKTFSFFNNKPPASWVTDITKDFLACYSCSYYSGAIDKRKVVTFWWDFQNSPKVSKGLQGNPKFDSWLIALNFAPTPNKFLAMSRSFYIAFRVFWYCQIWLKVNKMAIWPGTFSFPKISSQGLVKLPKFMHGLIDSSF